MGHPMALAQTLPRHRPGLISDESRAERCAGFFSAASSQGRPTHLTIGRNFFYQRLWTGAAKHGCSVMDLLALQHSAASGEPSSWAHGRDIHVGLL